MKLWSVVMGGIAGLAVAGAADDKAAGSTAVTAGDKWSPPGDYDMKGDQGVNGAYRPSLAQLCVCGCVWLRCVRMRVSACLCDTGVLPGGKTRGENRFARCQSRFCFLTDSV